MAAPARYVEFDPEAAAATIRQRTDPAFNALVQTSLDAQMAEFRRTHPGGGMGFFDFLGDVGSAIGSAASTVFDVAKTVVPKLTQPQTIVGLPSLQQATGIDPLGKLFGGDFLGGLTDVAKIGSIVATGGATAPAVLGGNVLGGALGKIASGDYAGGILGLAGTVFQNKAFPPRPAPPPAPGSLTRTPSGRTIPPLPTTIPLTLNPGGTMLASTFSIGGPKGLFYNSGPTGGGALSGGSGYGVNVGPGTGFNVAQARSALLKNASENAGYRLGWKKILQLLFCAGLDYTMQTTGLSAPQLLFLYVNRPHRGRRGPHLKTIAKRARQVQGYRRSIARIGRIIGLGAHHHRTTYSPPQRRLGGKKR